MSKSELRRLNIQFEAKIAQLEESLEVCSREILRLEAKERELEAENAMLYVELAECWCTDDIEAVCEQIHDALKEGG